MNSNSLILIVLFCIINHPVFAEKNGNHDGNISIQNVVLQKGTYRDISCEKEKADELKIDKGFCYCVANINYPVISGMLSKSAQDEINDYFKSYAEEVKCKGNKVDNAGELTTRESKFDYKLIETNNNFISIVSDYYNYNFGTHGHSQANGVVIDIKTGAILSIDDIFGKNNTKINSLICHNINQRDKGKGLIVSDESCDENIIQGNECKNCTVWLTNNGATIQFYEYAIGSFAENRPEFHIPPDYIAYPHVQKSGIYWAATREAVAAGTDRCKHFDTPNLEEQLNRLLKKYGGNLKNAKIMTSPLGGHVFSAYRYDDVTQKNIDYSYFDSFQGCDNYQSEMLNNDTDKAKQTQVKIANEKWYRFESSINYCSKGNPAKLIESLETLNKQYQANDIKENGIITQTTISADGYYPVTFYRGKERCLAIVESNQKQRQDKTNDAVNRYK